MIKKYYNFLHFVLFFVFLTNVPTKIYSQCAGSDAALSVCDFANPANKTIDLFALLGPATAGGTWSDEDNSGGLDAVTGILNAHVITSSGIYRYTYTVAGIAGCTDNSSVVTVTIGGYTGTPTFAAVCTSSGTFNLFQAFNTTTSLSPHSNGQWHNDTTNQNIPGSVISILKLSGQYQFTYTMTAMGSCPAPPPATIYVNVNKAPESGVPQNIKICSDDVSNYTNYDLNNTVLGADPGGVWADVNLRSTGELTFVGDHNIDIEKIYNRFGQGDFFFTYTVSSTDPVCSPAVTRVKIRIEKKLDFTGATIVVNSDICETEIATATYSIRINKGPAAIPNGNYKVKFNVSGPNGGTETITANITNGVFLFPIKSDYFKQVGDFTVTILDIYAETSEQACINLINNLSDVLHIYALPDLTGAKIAEAKTCQNNSATIVISDAIKIKDGIYDLRYNISGANNANAQNVRVTFTGGNATFTIPSFLNSQSGNAVITITNITHVISQCPNTSDVKGDIVIIPSPNIASLKIQISDYCFGDAVTASISGLGSLTDVTLSYVLSGKNTSAVQTLVLTPVNGNATFIIPSGLLLNTGSTTATITNLTNNITTCSINVSGINDPFLLNPIPAAPSASNLSFCKSEGATILNLIPNGSQYKWYDSATATVPLDNSSVLVSQNYYVRITTAGCTSDPTMILVTINDTPAPELNEPADFCGLNNPTLLDLSNKTDISASVLWYDAPNNGNLLPSSTILVEQGKYYGFGYSSTTNCRSYERLDVTVSLTHCDDVPNDFFIPDGFSPNGDGVNDTFVIPNIEFLYPNFTLEILNRYGNGMYKGYINKPGWDGTNYETNGVASGVAPNGVYFYILNFNKDNKKPKQGRLYLNR
jgi:gliding motility-associated-like protein